MRVSSGRSLLTRLSCVLTIVLGACGCQQTIVTDTNSDGTWTALAVADAGKGVVNGTVTFTGPEDKTRRMGMCLLQRYEPTAEAVGCETLEDCSSAQKTVPVGGSRYCVAPNGSGPKFCHYRPGALETYCAGSPSQGRGPIPPGTYKVSAKASAGSHWVALTCFDACTETAPSASAETTVR